MTIRNPLTNTEATCGEASDTEARALYASFAAGGPMELHGTKEELCQLISDAMQYRKLEALAVELDIAMGANLPRRDYDA